MPEFDKPTPEPLEREDPVAGALGRIAARTKGTGDADERDDDVTIEFRVAGGAPGQRYKLALRTTGRQVRTCTYDCDLSDRHRAAERPQIEGDLVPALAERLLRSDVLAVRTAPPSFLPDTVIGTITITAGGISRTVRFAADPDQAAVQDLATPPQVQAAADALYDLAGRVLDMDDVRP